MPGLGDDILGLGKLHSDLDDWWLTRGRNNTNRILEIILYIMLNCEKTIAKDKTKSLGNSEKPGIRSNQKQENSCTWNEERERVFRCHAASIYQNR